MGEKKLKTKNYPKDSFTNKMLHQHRPSNILDDTYAESPGADITKNDHTTGAITKKSASR